MRRIILLMALATFLAAAAWPSFAQTFRANSAARDPQNDSLDPASSGLPSPGGTPHDAVAPGTRFLIALNDSISTRKDKAGQKFKAHTLEKIVTPGGWSVPAGAVVRGHVEKVEPAGQAGRARLWLAFDTIDTPAGRMSLVADISDTPGGARHSRQHQP